MPEEFMSTVDIVKSVKIFNNLKGKPIEVLVPYSMFEELMELKVSMEIYKQDDVQQSLRRAKKELTNRKVVSFRSINEALRWLKQ